MKARFLLAGDTALVVEFGDRIERAVSDDVLRLSARVRGARIRGVTETVPTYRSLMIHYDPLVTDSSRVRDAIEELLGRHSTESREVKLWRIPACYGVSHAPDLQDVAERTGLTTNDVVKLHVGTCFHVYMIGFVPGFPYMGDLPESLVLPRRTDPRVKVPAGSIAIAVGQTAIYPLESPGGWHLIGATPIRLFDPASTQPALLAPGDKVRFEAVDAREFAAISEAVARGVYRVPCETIAA
jgi:KipI family sensor histidine kinase inhibitor